MSLKFRGWVFRPELLETASRLVDAEADTLDEAVSFFNENLERDEYLFSVFVRSFDGYYPVWVYLSGVFDTVETLEGGIV